MKVNQDAIQKALEQTRKGERLYIEPLFTQREHDQLQDVLDDLTEDDEPKKPSEAARFVRKIVYHVTQFLRTVIAKVYLWRMRRYALKCANKVDYHKSKLTKYKMDLESCRLAETMGCNSVKELYAKLQDLNNRVIKKVDVYREPEKPTSLDPATAFTALDIAMHTPALADPLSDLVKELESSEEPLVELLGEK